eukprot:224576-Pyramimonas_sp.AAC.1
MAWSSKVLQVAFACEVLRQFRGRRTLPCRLTSLGPDRGGGISASSRHQLPRQLAAPEKQADPSSKASIKKPEALMQRRAKFPEDLPVEFDLLHKAATATAAEADSVSFYIPEE